MAKPVCARALLGAMLVALILMVGVSAHASEKQLAGIQLGQHAINLLDVYGTPDGVVTGEGEEIAAPAAAGGMGAGMGPGMPGGGAQMGAMDMGMGGLAGMLGGMMGGMPGMPGGMPGMPGGAMPGMPGGPGGMPGGGPGGPGAMPGMPGGMPGMPGAPGGMPGMMPGGAPGGPMAGGGAAGAGAGVSAAPFPTWGMPVWVTLKSGEVEWLYRKYGVVMGFVLDRDGYINVIAVAAEECNYARTALWAPHKFIKLGDNFRQVIYRYGYPDETLTFDGSGTGEVGPGGGSITFSVNGTNRVFSRDCVLRYSENNNIAFTLHNMTVTRIHIWKK